MPGKPRRSAAVQTGRRAFGHEKQAFYIVNLALAAFLQAWAVLYLPYVGVSSLEFDRLLGVFFFLQAITMPYFGLLVLNNVAGQGSSQKFKMLKLLDFSRFRLVMERLNPDVPLMLLPLLMAPTILAILWHGFPALFWGWFYLYFALFVAYLEVALFAVLLGLALRSRLRAQVALLSVLIAITVFLVPFRPHDPARPMPTCLRTAYLATFPAFLSQAHRPAYIFPADFKGQWFPPYPDATVFPPAFYDMLNSAPGNDGLFAASEAEWRRESWTPAHEDRELPGMHFKVSGLIVMLLFLACAKLIDRL